MLIFQKFQIPFYSQYLHIFYEQPILFYPKALVVSRVARVNGIPDWVPEG